MIYWRCDEGSGLVLTDITDNKNNGTMVGNDGGDEFAFWGKELERGEPLDNEDKWGKESQLGGAINFTGNTDIKLTMQRNQRL